MSSKDYFSSQSKAYATFRPTYPDELFQFIFKHLKNRETAWDCATGNGQAAKYLARYFKKVYASDISHQQLNNAAQVENIIYTVGKAEESGFTDRQFDLVTVAQALHWFDRKAFYQEVKRVCKPDGLIAVWGYGNLTISKNIDKLFLDFYNNIIGPYWDDARRLVENEYRGIEFPFHEIASPKFEIRVVWTLQQFAGYLNSWSATQKFISVNGYNPVDEFIDAITPIWNEQENKLIVFPVFLKLGKTAD